ncbi:universal stress protein [Cumulibacter manganitolerans]|uniref:universal stress protein n=1 Tax=Cumulibacter manganitolerans TaxID=1884992 RepID=UPI001297B7A4|nr:universal stress protein [Cumulibacter manganitolerans]
MAPIVVGYDGLEDAEHALTWAVADAAARERPLRLVCAYPSASDIGPVPGYGEQLLSELEVVRAGAAQVVAGGARRVSELAPEVSVTTRAEQGSAAAVLLEESASAAVMVLGSRGLGAVGASFLGSVGTAVAARAACPVVVVGEKTEHGGSGTEVVVGIDGYADSQAILDFAFDHASWHGTPLRAVLCWHRDALSALGWSAAAVPEKTEAWLSEALAGWQEKYPDVRVRTSVLRDRPVVGLLAAGRGQKLLVVGSRGRHALAGTLLGSVSQGVLHHATCPVAVVPVR